MKKFLSVYFLLFAFEIYVVPVYAEDVAAQEGIQRVQAISFTSGTEKSMEISVKQTGGAFVSCGENDFYWKLNDGDDIQFNLSVPENARNIRFVLKTFQPEPNSGVGKIYWPQDKTQKSELLPTQEKGEFRYEKSFESAAEVKSPRVCATDGVVGIRSAQVTYTLPYPKWDYGKTTITLTSPEPGCRVAPEENIGFHWFGTNVGDQPCWVQIQRKQNGEWTGLPGVEAFELGSEAWPTPESGFFLWKIVDKCENDEVRIFFGTGEKPDSERLKAEQLAKEKAEAERLAKIEADRKAKEERLAEARRLAEEKAKKDEELRKKKEEELRKAIATWTQSTTRPAGTRKTLTVNGVDFTFRWCPAGEFRMGEEEDVKRPIITLTKGFWLLENEVTQAQWTCIAYTNPSNFKGNNRPVECVTWTQCNDYCQALSKRLPPQIKCTATLPTEYQWEYACRANQKPELTTTATAWYHENSGYTTHEVCTKTPNAWGLYDMYGNVSEWCSNHYEEDGKGISSATDPTGPPSGKRFVLRGGHYQNYAKFANYYYRDADTAIDSYKRWGFRCALIPE